MATRQSPICDTEYEQRTKKRAEKNELNIKMDVQFLLKNIERESSEVNFYYF